MTAGGGLHFALRHFSDFDRQNHGDSANPPDTPRMNAKNSRRSKITTIRANRDHLFPKWVLQKEEYLFLHGLCKRNFKYFQLGAALIHRVARPSSWGCPKRVFPPKMAIFGVPKTVLLFQPSVWWRVPRGNLHWTLSWPRVYAFQIKRVFQTYPNSSGATFHPYPLVI